MITSIVLFILLLAIVVATIRSVRRDGYGASPPPPSSASPRQTRTLLSHPPMTDGTASSPGPRLVP